MKYPHLWMRVYNTPLMILPEKAMVIEQVLRGRFEGHAGVPQELAVDAATPRPSAFSFRGADKPYRMSEGRVATIPVIGALVQRGSFIDAMSGLTSYNRINGLLDEALADSDVGGILLEIDSPGGEVHGVFDLAKKIYAARGVKPVWAAINEESYSAGYAITAAAERICLPESGCLGSIGVIALHVDQSKRDEKAGCVYTAIYAGKWKNDWTEHAPLSDHARKAGQAEVDRYYGLFTGGVAMMRGIDEDVVRATEAGILAPAAAIELGLADAIGTITDTLAELEAHVEARSKTNFLTGTRTAAGHSQEKTMQNQGTNQPAAATLTAEQQQAHAAELQAARTESERTGREAGATAERARVKAILGCDEAKGRTKLAQHLAFDTDMNADQAKQMLAVSAVEAAAAPANPLAVAMSSVDNPNVGAGGGAQGGDEDADAMARRIAGVGAAAPAK